MKGKDWLNSEENAIELKDEMGRKLYESLGYTMRKTIESEDTCKWDLTLMGTILKSIKFNVSGLQINDYQKQVKEENQKIEKLLKIHNVWAHNANIALSDKEFNEFWDEMTDILVSFGESEEELEMLKMHQIIIETKNHIEFAKKAKELKDLGK